MLLTFLTPPFLLSWPLTSPTLPLEHQLQNIPMVILRTQSFHFSFTTSSWSFCFGNPVQYQHESSLHGMSHTGTYNFSAPVFGYIILWTECFCVTIITATKRKYAIIQEFGIQPLT